ncbi:MAG: carotenoid biosynthesis protein [Candidatus Limnocylindrales bacterium]
MAAAGATGQGAATDRLAPAGEGLNGRILIWLAVVLLCLFAYEGVLRALLLGIVRLPLLPGGLITLTTIVAMCSLTHAWYSLGGRHTLAFFSLSAAISWVFEQVGVATGLVFGAYHYTDYLGAKLGDVPLLIPLAWFMMIYPSYVIANLAIERRATGTPQGVARLIRLAAVSALVMTAWDLVIDPILSGPSVRAWIWEAGGPYFGIPIQNYAGWLLTTFTVYLAYRALEQRFAPVPLGPVTDSVAALAVATYAAMLASDLLSGVAPAGLAAIGPVVMGVPLAVAAWRLRLLRMATS